MKNPKSPISLEKRIKNGASKSRKSVRKVSKTRSGNKGVATEGTRGVGMPPPPTPPPRPHPHFNFRPNKVQLFLFRKSRMLIFTVESVPLHSPLLVAKPLGNEL